MKITADTNLLVRMATRDEEEQAATARRVMTMAEAIIVPLPCVLEFVWVLRSVYRFSRGEIARALHVLIESSSVVADAPAIRAGLHIHAAGGDFADGVIAAAGSFSGSEVFVSFDRKALSHVSMLGISARHADDFP